MSMLEAEAGGTDGLTGVAHPDPFLLELKSLQNQLREKERELGAAQNEIKALRATQVLKDKAVDELQNEVKRLGDKLGATENLLHQQNLDIKKLNNEKKEALAAQYAAEATLRRVYADQQDDNFVPMESIIAPLEADIKMYKNEIALLQEDKRAMERLNRSKEAALLEAEGILKSALERALVVEEEENKLLEKTNRQKVLEVEKLSNTIKELEEAVLAGGEAANKIRDYRRQISELQEEKRTLERELARIKVSANRVASVVANEWKDENDKVMPVKQWLDERKLLQAEMQRLREKLATVEKTAKAEAQLKDKLKLRLKTLEDGLRKNSGTSKPEKHSNFFGILSSNARLHRKRSTSQRRASAFRSPEIDLAEKTRKKNNSIKEINASEDFISLWANHKKIVYNGEKENNKMRGNSTCDIVESNNEDPKNKAVDIGTEDVVSGFLYDRLQKEVLSLRKSCEAKDSTLNSKEEDIKMLNRKIETLTKAFEIECKKTKKEATTAITGQIPAKVDEKIRNTNSSKRVVKTPVSGESVAK
ncbi:OLC1v1021123C1 [Oldenlandia corymbosa var. corymbosa]|uniref:OLC1v1021123C1 n=1 Tax=Oldenlandia corymbosa var. corymbosa TaxID=529605 RepID=A0AAV1BUZ2_OLDCO|nr:OLC1v1021123C1 [Oldenlandia corymbosa var. corymbosa]